MAETYILFSVFTVILLVLAAKLEIIIEYNKEVKLEIRFLLISFFPGTEKKHKKKRSDIHKPQSLIKKLIPHLEEHAELYIKSLVITVPDAEPHVFSVRYRNLYNLILVSLTSLTSRFRKSSIRDGALKIISGDGFKLSDANLKVSAPLYFVLACILEYLFDKIPKKTVGRVN